MLFFYDFFHYSEEQYRKDLQIMANNMPSSSGMGNNNMRKGDRRDDRMQRGGSMSGSGYNNNNKLNRSAYQDNDGWIQQGGNKGRGGNNSSTSFDPSKFRTNSVSIAVLFLTPFPIVSMWSTCITKWHWNSPTEYRRHNKKQTGHTKSIPMEHAQTEPTATAND